LNVPRSLLLAIVGAAAVFVAAALALAILGIAQAGNGGKAWTDSSAISSGPVQLSLADVLALGAALVAGAVTFLVAHRR
jgi:hypothetical protein